MREDHREQVRVVCVNLFFFFLKLHAFWIRRRVKGLAHTHQNGHVFLLQKKRKKRRCIHEELNTDLRKKSKKKMRDVRTQKEKKGAFDFVKEKSSRNNNEEASTFYIVLHFPSSTIPDDPQRSTYRSIQIYLLLLLRYVLLCWCKPIPWIRFSCPTKKKKKAMSAQSDWGVETFFLLLRPSNNQRKKKTRWTTEAAHGGWGYSAWVLIADSAWYICVATFHHLSL